ncbi:unnamed protein product [Ectocarpus sp. 8 AP-2014]
MPQIFHRCPKRSASLLTRIYLRCMDGCMHRTNDQQKQARAYTRGMKHTYPYPPGRSQFLRRRYIQEAGNPRPSSQHQPVDVGYNPAIPTIQHNDVSSDRRRP